MTIPSYRLPVGLEAGSKFSPEFKVIVQEAVSGIEQRIRQWSECRGRGDIAFGLRDIDEPNLQLNYLRQVDALFKAHGGKLRPFRFRDWFDYQATDEPFGTGDAYETDFQLTKTYDPSQMILGIAGSYQYVRNIVLPVASSLVIYVDGDPVTDYTLSSGGIVQFSSPPSNGDPLTWTGEFDLPVRFDVDQLEIVLQDGVAAQIGSIAIREVIGEY